MGTYKIVLTGGPCGGKTESIKFLSNALSENKYSVKTVDETATSLLNLGYEPKKNISLFDFQNLLFKIQFLKEYISENKSNILLCDRGLLDAKTYIGDNDFKKVLELNRLDEGKILSTYDGALYFRSISYDYPEEYSSKRIYETVEVARNRDRECINIWKNKLVPCNYSNLDGFVNKQKSLYISLKESLEKLKNTNPHSLSDFYSYDYYKFIYDGIDQILNNNKVDHNIKVKTKDLAR